MAQLENLPYGTKGQTIKQTLRRGLGLTESTKQTSDFDAGELLSDIRRVMEATLESAISRLTITPLAGVPQTKPDETKVIDDILDNFGANLMMLDEEEEDF